MLDRDRTALAVVDFQEKLLPKIFNRAAIVPEAIRLIRAARILELGLLVSEQYPRGLGATVPEVVAELEGVPVHAKTAFGCFADEGFAEAAAALGRTQLLITGIEAHVCVMQTALGALERGYEVFVARDAVGSRKAADYEAGLARMARRGVEIVTGEMAIFELLGEAGTPLFKAMLPLLK